MPLAMRWLLFLLSISFPLALLLRTLWRMLMQPPPQPWERELAREKPGAPDVADAGNILICVSVGAMVGAIWWGVLTTPFPVRWFHLLLFSAFTLGMWFVCGLAA